MASHHDDDDAATPGQLFMISIGAIPVLGAVISAPLVGFTLVTLALLDSVLFTGGTF